MQQNNEKPITWQTYSKYGIIIAIPHDSTNKKVVVTVKEKVGRNAQLIDVIDDRHCDSNDENAKKQAKIASQKAQLCIAQSNVCNIVTSQPPEHLKNIAIKSKKNATGFFIINGLIITFAVYTVVSICIIAGVCQVPDISRFGVMLVGGFALVLFGALGGSALQGARAMFIAKKELIKSSVNLTHAIISSQDTVSNVCENMVRTVLQHITERLHSSPEESTEVLLIESQQIISECYNHFFFTSLGCAVHFSTRNSTSVSSETPSEFECSKFSAIVTNILEEGMTGAFDNYEGKVEIALNGLIKMVKEQQSGISEMGEFQAGAMRTQISGMCYELRTHFEKHFASMNNCLSRNWLSERDQALITHYMPQDTKQPVEVCPIIMDPSYEKLGIPGAGFKAMY